jgi:hypothetical protein
MVINVSNKRAQIYCGFPGVGKSSVFNTQKELGLTILDSDSSQFSWISKGERHPDFPNNYMNHIIENINKADIIMVSTHTEVLDALWNRVNGLATIVYPDPSLKEEYLERYRKRGSDSNFVNLMNSKWESFIDGIERDNRFRKIKLKSGQYMSDALNIK